MRGAPDLRGDGAGRGGRQEEDVAVGGRRGGRGDGLPEPLAARAGRRAQVRCDEGQAPQAGVHVLAARAVCAALAAECESDFGALLDEVCDERGRERHPALETLGRAHGRRLSRRAAASTHIGPRSHASSEHAHFILLRGTGIFIDERVEDDVDAAVVLGGELTHSEAVGARRRFQSMCRTSSCGW